MGRFEDERKELVRQLMERGISDPTLLAAIGRVERHRFVLPALHHRAYEDTALPISAGQTISQPYTVAFMTQELGVQKDSKVLEIGTGSGYQGAILAELGCRVFTIERHMELHLQSRKLLESLGYRIATRCGDGTIGWSEYAPYDGIIVTAAAPEVPTALLNQLAVGGRLVIPVGEQNIQTIRIITRLEDGYETRDAPGFKFVPLIGKDGWKQ
jgi:protein-L-isoaspartate(D-aspartate) O-methyltransferase